jgi:hypothetical protein
VSHDSFDDGEGDAGSGRESPTATTRYSAVTENLDAAFDVLSEARRRYLLYYLLELDGEVTDLDAAVEAVRTYEGVGTETGDPPPEEQVRTALHHVHLPRLGRTGIVDYDPRQGTIRFAGHPSLEEYAEHARHRETNR